MELMQVWLRHGLTLFFMALIAWQSVVRGIGVWRTHETSENLNIPLGPFYFVICVGAILFCLELIFELAESVSKIQRVDKPLAEKVDQIESPL